MEDEKRPNIDGRGGARPGSGRPKKTEQNDAYTAFAKAKAVRETCRAKQAEIDLRKRNNELIEREPAERAAFALWRVVSRQLVDVLPAEVAAEMARTSDAAEAETALRNHLRSTLERLSKLSPDEVMQG